MAEEKELTLSEVKELVKELLGGPNNENDATFKAGVLIIVERFRDDLAHYTGYDVAFVQSVIENCVKNGIWGPDAYDDKTAWMNEKEFWKISVGFTLFALCASGELYRQKTSDGDALYGIVGHKYEEKPQKTPWEMMSYEEKMARCQKAKEAWKNRKKKP